MARRPVIAAVLGGGVGRRVGRDIPKQLIPIGGRPIIEHAVRAFQRAPDVDEIVVLMAPGYEAQVEESLARGRYDKVSRVLSGGAARTDTTRRFLAAAAELVAARGHDDGDVLVHDAARPFVEQRIIADCVAALATHEAVNVAIPSSDTIIAVDASGTLLTDVPPRDRLRRVQTPQCFRLSTITRAYERAAADPDFASGAVTATDDCGVVRRYLPEVPIVVVPGSERNIKITHPLDLVLAEQLLRTASEEDEPSAGAGGGTG